MSAWIIPAVLSVAGLLIVIPTVRLLQPARGAHAAGPLTPDVRTQTIPRAPTAARPPWDPAGDGLPAWAAPEADRVTAFGMDSGSMGSDYGPPTMLAGDQLRSLVEDIRRNHG